MDVHIHSACEGRQQGRVNIHDSISPFPAEPGGKNSHESDEKNKFDALTLQYVGHFRIVRLPGLVLMADKHGFDAMIPCPFQDVGLFPVADHDFHGRGEPSPVDGIDNDLQVRTLSGSQNAQFRRFHATILSSYETADNWHRRCCDR